MDEEKERHRLDYEHLAPIRSIILNRIPEDRM